MPASSKPIILDPTGRPASQAMNEPPPLRPRQFKDAATSTIIYAGLRARELPTQAIEEFSKPDEVRAILHQHARGDFSRSAKLVDAMLADPRIAGALDQRIGGLEGLPFTMEPAELLEQTAKPKKKKRALQARAEQISRELHADWNIYFPLEDRINLRTWGYMLGVGIAQLLWEPGASRWPARVQVWHPSALTWDDLASCYYVTTLNQGRLKVTPGDGQWILFTPYGYEHGWMRALVRKLAVPFCARLFGTTDLLRASETHGNAARVGRFPRKADSHEVAAFLEGLARLATDSAVGLPVEDPGPGMSAKDVAQYDATLMQANPGNERIFEVLLSRADADIAIAIRGQTLTTEVRGGSRAAAEVHENVESRLIRQDGKQATDCFREQYIRPLVVANYGEPQLTPTPTWDTQPPVDTEKRAKTLVQVATYIEKMRKGALLLVDGKALDREFKLGLKLTEDGSVEEVPGAVLPDDLTNGTLSRDERRRALNLPPLGGRKGRELLGDVAQSAEVPPEATLAEGDEAEETLLTVLSLGSKALLQLHAGNAEAYRKEARWFARQHSVAVWAPAIERELVRRGELALHAAEPPPMRPSRAHGEALTYVDKVVKASAALATQAMAPVLEAILAAVKAATSYEDLRERLEAVYASKGVALSEEEFADAVYDAMGLARLAGNLSVLEETGESK